MFHIVVDAFILNDELIFITEPTFIKMIEFQDYIYIFLREIAETWETGSSEVYKCSTPKFDIDFDVPKPNRNHILIFMIQQTYARVARICKNDSGGVHVLSHRWTTFIKARLICDTSGKESNVFNNLTSVSDMVPMAGSSENVDYFVFATFTSPW